MNVARLIYIGCKILGISKAEVLRMTLREFYLIFDEYLSFNGIRKKEELDLDLIF